MGPLVLRRRDCSAAAQQSMYFQVGDVKITRVVEMEGPVPGSFLFPDATPEAVLAHAWLREHFVTEEGLLRSCIQATMKPPFGSAATAG